MAIGVQVPPTLSAKSITGPWFRRNVRRLQCRIAKAVKEGRWNKVKALQHLLTRSLHAKLMAVQRMAAPLNSTLSLGNFPSESMPCDCGAANSIARRPT